MNRYEIAIGKKPPAPEPLIDVPAYTDYFEKSISLALGLDYVKLDTIMAQEVQEQMRVKMNEIVAENSQHE